MGKFFEIFIFLIMNNQLHLSECKSALMNRETIFGHSGHRKEKNSWASCPVTQGISTLGMSD